MPPPPHIPQSAEGSSGSEGCLSGEPLFLIWRMGITSSPNKRVGEEGLSWRVWRGRPRTPHFLFLKHSIK